MTICYLTPSDRTDVIPPPLIRPPKKRPEFNGRDVISAAEYQRLPAHEKAGFLLAHDKGFYFRKWSPRDSRREAAHRLVEASKSPTHENDQLELQISKHKFLKKLNAPELVPFNIDYSTGEVLPHNQGKEFEPVPQVVPHGTAGTSTIIQFREWSQEWRIRTETRGANLNPPTQAGDRISEMLSERGAKKIAEACEYMATKGGFKTFVTGTFDEETRKQIKSGETTIQREVSRCVDGLQKMYQRGWVTPEGEQVKGHGEGLAYCWVVEIPLNENYEENPHVHMLLGWSVPFRLFKSWSARIERIWGNGYFHLEKIKDCACAGAYMAKAAGYMTKAQDDESQGKVKGNRYGISETARAPEWLTLGRAQLHSMGQIIADVYDHLTLKYGADYRERKQLKVKLDAIPKDQTALRQRIGERLQKVREKLNALPIRCNKYQVILKGQTIAGLFLTWAKGEKVSRPEWLPELPADLVWQEGRQPVAADMIYFRKLREKFQQLKRRRHAWTDCMLAGLVDKWESLKADALSAYESWCNLDLCQ